jgi:ferredoxin
VATAVYYFSGTGNSLVVARELTESLNGELIPISPLVSKEAVPVHTEVAGLVFPVYYGDAPPIIREFASKLDPAKNCYLFTLCTFGGGEGNSHRTLDRIFRKRGLILSATFGVHMPQNAFSKPGEKYPRIHKKWRRKRRKIVKHVLDRNPGSLLIDRLFRYLLLPITLMIAKSNKKFLSELAEMPPEKSIEELHRGGDRSFYAAEACNGCGTCAEICPVDNIEMLDYKPRWKHRCEQCLACYNWCPEQAIRNKIAQKGFYYRHPDVTAAEIKEQKIYAET